jgi:hypothetical protein
MAAKVWAVCVVWFKFALFVVAGVKDEGWRRYLDTECKALIMGEGK